MAHRKKLPQPQELDPLAKAVIGVLALILGIVLAVGIISYAWEALVTNLPWNAW
jgi:hypothetical protein